MDDPHPALARLFAEGDNAAAVDLLAELPGADLTTVLLEVARRRAAGLSPADVMSQYRRDRFMTPGAVDPRRLARLEVRALEIAQPEFVPVALAPLAPFGTHAVLGGVHQNRVVTTTRPGEVAADPTASLALEAAVRRRRLLDADPRSDEPVRLAAVQRVLRAQVFDDAEAYPHFALLGMVTAGRDTGGRGFEVDAVVDHLRVLVTFAAEVAPGPITVQVSDLDGGFGGVVDRVCAAVASPDVRCEPWPERTAGAGYYPNVCFKLNASRGDEEIEVADGGIVPWTQMLLQSRKERLMISGLGLERLAPPG